LQDKRNKCQGADTAIDQQPETGGAKVAFWASTRDRFDINCHRLANHECRHRTDEKTESAVVEISACKDADEQEAEDEYPRAVILWDGGLFFEDFSHVWGKHTRKPVCAQGGYNIGNHFKEKFVCQQRKK